MDYVFEWDLMHMCMMMISTLELYENYGYSISLELYKTVNYCTQKRIEIEAQY